MLKNDIVYRQGGGCSMANVLSNLTGLFKPARISLAAALLCISIHEMSHGFVSYKLGDSTAKSMGG